MEPRGTTMSIPKPLEPEKLFHRCDVSQFKFASTAELEAKGKFIGFAANLNKPGRTS